MGFKTKSVFYMAVPVANADGTIEEPGADGVRSDLDENALIENATTDVQDHGGVVIIYKCVPVKKLSAYRVKVEPITAETVEQN